MIIERCADSNRRQQPNPNARASTTLFPPHRYDFDKHHDGCKQVLMNSDFFLAGITLVPALLFFGDLKAMRTGAAKVLDAHKRVLELVRQGTTSADR